MDRYEGGFYDSDLTTLRHLFSHLTHPIISSLYAIIVQIYDCDFNQQLGMGLGVPGGRTIFDIESTDDLLNINIKTDNHCFGCTAGMGSSCQGATA
jgi:Protein of unknown function (DUF3641)